MTVMLTLSAALLPAALVFSDSGLAVEKDERGIVVLSGKKKPLNGADTKTGKGKSSWQPRQFAVSNDLGNITGGQAKGARGLRRAVNPAVGGSIQLQPSVKPPVQPANPSTWAKPEQLRTGKTNLYDHTFEPPKNRRRR